MQLSTKTTRANDKPEGESRMSERYQFAKWFMRSTGMNPIHSKSVLPMGTGSATRCLSLVLRRSQPVQVKPYVAHVCRNDGGSFAVQERGEHAHAVSRMSQCAIARPDPR